MAEIKTYAKPIHLYRYRPLGSHLKRELDAVVDHYIFCPSYQEMNDPMEGKYRTSLLFEESKNSSKNKAEVERELGAMGIASMSEVYDHEPMWAHYAAEFSGMCVCYNLNRLLRGLPDTVSMSRVLYSEIEPVLINDKSTPMDRARLCLSSKTVRWASEREWRLFQSSRGKASYGDERPIAKIYLGSRVTAADSKAVCDAAKELRVQVFRMDVLSYSVKFNLLFSPSIIRRLKRSRVRAVGLG